MTPLTFDDLTKLVGQLRSRRAGLGLALSAGLAAIAQTAAPAEAARCTKTGRSCRRDGDCCSRACKGSGKNKTCRDTKLAKGCTIERDACRAQTSITCPKQRDNFCVILNNGKPFCAAESPCKICQKSSDCPPLPGAGKPRCILDCPNCGSSNVCVYPNRERG